MCMEQRNQVAGQATSVNAVTCVRGVCTVVGLACAVNNTSFDTVEVAALNCLHQFESARVATVAIA